MHQFPTFRIRQDLSAWVISAGEPAVYRVQTGGSVLLEVAAAHAARVRSMKWTAGRCRITVELANSARIRPFVEAVDRSVGSTEIRSHRKSGTRNDEHWLVPVPLQEMTVQERETLEAAYAGGYFNWPRDQTGVEIAASMGVAQSTFARHLRGALQTVLQVIMPRENGPTD
ncbi:MAG: helix-turn-helix domain-containing protein [Natrialbaceae archaeon]|nr:helix-turn-helix domain-containing protein [Natrialbaceae archaeon]